MLAETIPFQGVAEHGAETDRRSWTILIGDFSNHAGKTDENDTKFKTEVSHFH
jgi:hypothetical protein